LDGHRRSYFREAIEDCGTDFEFGDLAIKGTRGDALAEQLEATHLGFNQTAAVVATPFLPDCPTKPFNRAQRLIAGINAGAIFGPWPPVAADRDDRICAAPCDGGVASLGIICAITADAEDGLIFRDLRQKIG